MRHVPSNLDKVRELNKLDCNDPSRIPDGSLLAVHRPLGLDPLTLNSLAIRLIKGSWANHGAVKGRKHGKHVVWDSGVGGVMPYDWHDWIRYHWPKYWYVVPPIKEVDNKDWLKYELRPYDYEGVYIHHIWYSLTGNWIGKTGIEAAEKTYCNEFWCHEMGLENAHLLATSDVLDLMWEKDKFRSLNGL